MRVYVMERRIVSSIALPHHHHSLLHFGAAKALLICWRRYPQITTIYFIHVVIVVVAMLRLELLLLLIWLYQNFRKSKLMLALDS